MTLSLPNYPGRLPNPLINVVSLWGGEMRLAGSGSFTSTAWGTINQARYMPIWVPEPLTIVKLLAYNGGTAAGNTDIGLYDSAGNEIVGIAAAAQAGLNTWQEFDIVDTPLRPGVLYYIGLLNTTTTGTYTAWPSKEAGRAVGVFSQAVGAATLPSPTATFAALDAAVVPIVGMSTRVLI